MAKYSFTVRKRDCEICLTTDDKDAVEQQLAIWILALSRKPLSKIVEEVKEQEEILNQPAVPEIVEETPYISEPQKEDFVVPQPEVKVFEPERIDAEVVAPDSDVKTKEYVEDFINTIPAEETVTTINSITPPPLKTDVAVTLNALFNAEAPTSADFESILERSVDNIKPDTSSVVKKDENFCKLVKANNITDRLELLLFTADYFCKYDARFVFSLKQINGKLMNNLAVIVDHGILKIALDNNYLEREGESEYRLTEYGRSEIYSKMGIWS